MTKKTYIAPILDIFEEEAEELLEASDATSDTAHTNTATIILNDKTGDGTWSTISTNQ